MDIITKEELEKKFELIKKSRSNEDKFWSAYFDYLQYLGKSNELAKIINKLALDNEIPVGLLQEIFDSSMKIPPRYFPPAFSLQSFISKKPESLKSFNEEKIERPSFWSEEIEEKFQLYKNYTETMDACFEKKKVSVNKKTKGIREKEKNELNFSTLQKLHNDIVRKIYPPELLKKKRILIKKLEFNENRSVLKINDIVVKITKFGKHFYILKCIFEQRDRLSEEWLYSEIAEQISSDDREVINESEAKISIKNAAYQLNQRIAVKAQIPDFFNLTNQSMTINAEYIPIE